MIRNQRSPTLYRGIPKHRRSAKEKRREITERRGTMRNVISDFSVSRLFFRREIQIFFINISEGSAECSRQIGICFLIFDDDACNPIFLYSIIKHRIYSRNIFLWTIKIIDDFEGNVIIGKKKIE